MSMLNEKTKVEMNENEFGVKDTFRTGLLTVKDQLSASHPLEKQETNYRQLEDKLTMEQLKISQGIYAPLKFEMERDFASKVGRLPCLKSSNLMLSVLRGTDETLEIEDVLNNQREHSEYNRDFHADV